MNLLFDPFTPFNFPDLFTLMWVSGILVSIGAIFVYNAAQRRYRRYPELLSLHEWVFWSIIVTWGIIPLLVVIGVPLILQLILILSGIGVAAYAAFVRFPERIEAANAEIRRRRFVPPPRRDPRERPKPTPAGRRRKHRP